MSDFMQDTKKHEKDEPQLRVFVTALEYSFCVLILILFLRYEGSSWNTVGGMSLRTGALG